MEGLQRLKVKNGKVVEEEREVPKEQLESRAARLRESLTALQTQKSQLETQIADLNERLAHLDTLAKKARPRAKMP